MNLDFDPFKPRTNTELVAGMMEYSSFGALSQIFIIDAIRRQAKAVAAATPAELGGDALISPQAWQRVAKDIDARMTAFYAGLG